MGAYYLLQENGDSLLQETGGDDKILLQNSLYRETVAFNNYLHVSSSGLSVTEKIR